MKKLDYILILFLVLLLPGCIRENLDECWNVELCFRYDLNGKNVISEHIQKLNVYVLDEDKKCVASKEYEISELGQSYVTPKFRLDPGFYTIVAVGNQFENTEITGLESGDLSSMYFQHPDTGSGEKIKTYDKNYCGRTSFDLGAVTTYRDTVDMELSHLNLLVQIIGLDKSHIQSEHLPYYVEIEDVNALTDFNNHIDSVCKEKCIPDMFYDETTGIISTEGLSLFRFDQVCNMQISLYDDSGDFVISKDVNTYMKEHPEVFDPNDPEAEIPIAFVFSDVGVSITVPDWFIEDIIPEL